MKKADLDITGLSKLTGIPYRSLQNYLRDEREPKIDALIKLSTHLGISLDWLLTGHGEMKRGGLRAQEAIPIYQVAGALDKREEAVLTLFRALDEDAQREIQQVAEEKKRLRDVEQHIKELQTELAEVKKLA